MDSNEDSGEWQPSEELRRFAEQQHIPIDRFRPKAPSQPSEEVDADLAFQTAKRFGTERMAIEALIRQYIAEHSTGWPMPYFEPPDDALVPYAAYRSLREFYWDITEKLTRRIERLERPWWRR